MQTDKAVRFIEWIRKQKQVCFEVWQIIKGVIRGNTPLLDEICFLTENSDNGSTSGGDNKAWAAEAEMFQQDEELYTSFDWLIACRYSDIDYINKLPETKKQTVFDRAKEEISRIGRKIKESFGSLFYNLKRYFL